MTQRDDAAVVDLHGSSESDERQSGIRAIGSMSFADEPSEEACRDRCDDAASVAANSEIAEEGAAQASTASAEPLQASEASEASRVERPTLMGLAPIELEGASEAAEGDSQLSAAEHAEADAEEPELSAEAAAAEQDEDEAPLRAPTVATWVGPAPSDPDSYRTDRAALPEDENDPEWLDLSTRWVIATGPHSEEDISDDSEVTNEMHWADHLAAGVRLRAESQSSAPPPPTAAVPQRHGTTAYGRTAEAPAARNWSAPAGAATRHPTLAGISPLPEDGASWPPPADPFASDGLRGARPSEQQPWGDEPSYKERPRHHTPRQSWAPIPHASVQAPVGTLPPWAAMSMYAPPPAAAVPQPYATGWNAPHMPPPAWGVSQLNAAAPAFATPQFYPTGAYPVVERRPSQSFEYTAPRRQTGSTPRHPGHAGQRREHTQQQGGEVTLEQWKNLANSWMGAIGKLAIAAMALHYSGLAVPLLGQLGYAPAAAAAGAQGSVASEPGAPGVAAASVIGDPARPTFAAPRADVNARDADTGADGYAAPSSSHWRRPGGKRESSAANESSSATRRRSTRSTHSHKPAAARAAAPASAKEAEDAPEANAAPASDENVEAQQPAAPSRTTEQLMAAAIGADDAASEAFLRINSRPWSQVYIDGTLVGTTPKIDLRVSAGPHRVRLVNPELGLSKSFQVDAPAGETISHVEQLDE